MYRARPRKLVGIGGLAVLHIERPATETPTLGQDHAIGVALGDLKLSRDGLRPVLDVDKGVLQHAVHAVVERQRRTAPERIRASCESGIHPLDRPVINGQHMIFLCLLHE